MAGRLEVRDWIDTLECHRALQPLGFLAWAACGKDEGLNPLLILGEASRSSHYAPTEVAALQWQGEPPDTPGLAREWKFALREAQGVVAALPLEHVGECVLQEDGTPFRGTLDEYHAAQSENRILFHAGSIRGAWPEIKTP